MREFGVDPNLAERHHGVPAAEIVRALLAEQERQPKAIRRIHELETTDVAGVIALPGANEALAALHHARSAIATSGTLALARARIAAAALVPPSVLVTADDVRRGKPAPDPFLEAARRLGVNPGCCVVLEDAPQGLAAATAAGCATLAVLTTTTRENLDADIIIPDLSAVTFEVTDEGIRGGPGPDARVSLGFYTTGELEPLRERLSEAGFEPGTIVVAAFGSRIETVDPDGQRMEIHRRSR